MCDIPANSRFDSTDLMALLIPTVSLSATAADTNATGFTNLTSSSMVYFVSVLFAGQTANGAAAAVPSALAAAIQRASAFTLPGTTLGIFPTGLIITGSWAGLFIA